MPGDQVYLADGRGPLWVTATVVTAVHEGSLLYALRPMPYSGLTTRFVVLRRHLLEDDVVHRHPWNVEGPRLGDLCWSDSRAAVIYSFYGGVRGYFGAVWTIGFEMPRRTGSTVHRAGPLSDFVTHPAGCWIDPVEWSTSAVELHIGPWREWDKEKALRASDLLHLQADPYEVDY